MTEATAPLDVVEGVAGRVCDDCTMTAADAADLMRGEFVDLDAIDVVGVFGNYPDAEEAWRDKAQRTVDDAEMRYVVVHLHRLLEPDLKKS